MDAPSTTSQTTPSTLPPPVLPQLPPVPTLDSTFGAILIGTFLSLILYGVSFHQLYRYLKLYSRRDGVVVKIFVYSTFTLETVLILVCMHACYHYLVTSYFDPIALVQGVWSFDAISLLAGLTICVSQCFFARRVYLLRPKCLPLVVVSVLFSFAAFALATAASVKTILASSLINPSSYVILDTIGIGAAVISDTLTTSVLVIVLKKSRTGLRRTDRMIDRLVLYSVNTGLLTV
ncbi:hypothetical protein C8Q77DRAFT_1121897 [Trametes polyzona]|nr:hypothetical protein C8Q77DRAFT_1121897 [Trametes polyzona]